MRVVTEQRTLSSKHTRGADEIVIERQLRPAAEKVTD